MSSPQPVTKQSFTSEIPTELARTKTARATWGVYFDLVVGLSLLLLYHPVALPQDDPVAAQPVTSEIIQRLVAENEQRSRELRAYTSRRHYHVAYRGFPHPAEADMIVDAVCSGPGSKAFDVISESGSRLLLDHVLKKLLKTEEKDAHNRADSALTPDNYTFNLVGTAMEGGRLLYVLRVEPILSRALLYRGKIWVDAQDYAVVKIEGQPAKNPSFWIRDTEIDRQYEKAGDFWLPRSDRSETRVRLGGTAVLTIDYGDYRFATATTSHFSRPQATALR